MISQNHYRYQETFFGDLSKSSQAGHCERSEAISRLYGPSKIASVAMLLRNDKVVKTDFLRDRMVIPYEN